MLEIVFLANCIFIEQSGNTCEVLISSIYLFNMLRHFVCCCCFWLPLLLLNENTNKISNSLSKSSLIFFKLFK